MTKEKLTKIIDGVIIELTQEEILEFNRSPSISDLDQRKQSLKNQLINIRKKYLKDTADYYMPDFPQEVLGKRTLARQQIQDITNATTLTALNSFDLKFD